MNKNIAYPVIAVLAFLCFGLLILLDSEKAKSRTLEIKLMNCQSSLELEKALN